MRIALVSQEYPPQTAGGGIGSQTFAKAHGLAQLGHSVFVISHSVDDDPCRPRRSGRGHEYDEGPVSVIRIPGFDLRMPLNTTEAWWLTYSSEVAAALTSLHQQSPLDLVDFPEYGGEAFTWLLNRAAVNRIPTVIHVHGPLAMLAETIGWPETTSEFYRTGTFMEGTSLRLADAVFSSSACSADWCARAYGVPRDTIAVMHTGVDTEHFSPRPVPKAERPTIIFVGRLTPSKGVDALVEAALCLASDIPGLRVCLIGRGAPDFCDWIRTRTASKGRPDLVEMLGYVSRDDLPDHLSRAHVFAAPSLYEGGPGFVYLEAMACGVPVIAGAGSGAAEVVVPAENGMLVPPGDVSALVGALRQLLTDAALREAMGARARTLAVERADSKQCVQRIDAFYRSVAARARQDVVL